MALSIEQLSPILQNMGLEVDQAEEIQKYTQSLTAKIILANLDRHINSIVISPDLGNYRVLNNRQFLEPNGTSGFLTLLLKLKLEEIDLKGRIISKIYRGDAPEYLNDVHDWMGLEGNNVNLNIDPTFQQFSLSQIPGYVPKQLIGLDFSTYQGWYPIGEIRYNILNGLSNLRLGFHNNMLYTLGFHRYSGKAIPILGLINRQKKTIYVTPNYDTEGSAEYKLCYKFEDLDETKKLDPELVHNLFNLIDRKLVYS